MPHTLVTVYRWTIVAQGERRTCSPLYATADAIRVLFASTPIAETALAVRACEVDAIGFYAAPRHPDEAATVASFTTRQAG